MRIEKLVFLITSVVLSNLCWSQKPIIQFEQVVIIDTIYYDSLINKKSDIPSKRYYFHFTNVGEAPLIMDYAKGGDPGYNCSYPKEPISQGSKGCLIICFPKFNYGSALERTFFISSNADTLVQLRVKRIPKEQTSAQAIRGRMFSFVQESCNCEKVTENLNPIKYNPVIQSVKNDSANIGIPSREPLQTAKPTVENKLIFMTLKDTVINPGINKNMDLGKPDTILKIATKDSSFTITKIFPDSIVTHHYTNGSVTDVFTHYIFKPKKGKKPLKRKEKHDIYKNNSVSKIIITTTYSKYGRNDGYWGQPLKKKVKTEIYEDEKWVIKEGKWVACTVPLN